MTTSSTPFYLEDLISRSQVYYIEGGRSTIEGVCNHVSYMQLAIVFGFFVLGTFSSMISSPSVRVYHSSFPFFFSLSLNMEPVKNILCPYSANNRFNEIYQKEKRTSHWIDLCHWFAGHYILSLDVIRVVAGFLEWFCQLNTDGISLHLSARESGEKIKTPSSGTWVSLAFIESACVIVWFSWTQDRIKRRGRRFIGRIRACLSSKKKITFFLSCSV